jgi:hypothetical protein
MVQTPGLTTGVGMARRLTGRRLTCSRNSGPARPLSGKEVGEVPGLTSRRSRPTGYPTEWHELDVSGKAARQHVGSTRCQA